MIDFVTRRGRLDGMPAPDDDQLLTVDQVARRLQLHPETIRRWIRDGRLRAIKLGTDRSGYRIRASELARVTGAAS